jgi:transaldolase
MPEQTLNALAEQHELGTIMSPDGGDCEEVLARFAEAGINAESLAVQLQDDGARSFVESWNELRAAINRKSVVMKKAG